MSSTRWQLLMLAGLAGFAACASPSNVRQVQNEVALLRAESARQDSAQAARLSEIIRLQQRIMDSLGLAVRSLRGTLSRISTTSSNNWCSSRSLPARVSSG